MKTIDQLQEEINDCILQLTTQKFEKASQKKKVKNRRDYLIVCKNYVETGVTEEFLKNEEKRLRNKIVLIEKGHVVDERLDLKRQKKDYQEYSKLMQLPKWRLQLKTIKFILSSK